MYDQAPQNNLHTRIRTALESLETIFTSSIACRYLQSMGEATVPNLGIASARIGQLLAPQQGSAEQQDAQFKALVGEQLPALKFVKANCLLMIDGGEVITHKPSAADRLAMEGLIKAVDALGVAAGLPTEISDAKEWGARYGEAANRGRG